MSDRGFKSYHDPQDEPSAQPLDPRAFDFDYGDALSKEQLKSKAVFSAYLVLLIRIRLGSVDTRGSYAPAVLNSRENIVLERKPIYRISLLQTIPYSTLALVLMAESSQRTLARDFGDKRNLDARGTEHPRSNGTFAHLNALGQYPVIPHPINHPSLYDQLPCPSKSLLACGTKSATLRRSSRQEVGCWLTRGYLAWI